MRKTREKKINSECLSFSNEKIGQILALFSSIGYVAEYWTSFIYMREEESAASRNEVL